MDTRLPYFDKNWYDMRVCAYQNQNLILQDSKKAMFIENKYLFDTALIMTMQLSEQGEVNKY